jgi:hypothetical protein
MTETVLLQVTEVDPTFWRGLAEELDAHPEVETLAPAPRGAEVVSGLLIGLGVNAVWAVAASIVRRLRGHDIKVIVISTRTVRQEVSITGQEEADIAVVADAVAGMLGSGLEVDDDT